MKKNKWEGKRKRREERRDKKNWEKKWKIVLEKLEKTLEDILKLKVCVRGQKSKFGQQGDGTTDQLTEA